MPLLREIFDTPVVSDAMIGDALVDASLLKAKPSGKVARPPVAKAAPAPADSSGDADSDPVQTAELIADILGGLFGDDALDAFETSEAEEQGKAFRIAHVKAWDALKHPRGANGRFIPKGSAEAQAAAKQGIDDIRKLGAGGRTPEHAKKLADHLSILTVKQLHELKKEYGLKASGKLRDELVAKLIDRLPGAQERIDSERKAAAKQLGLPAEATMRDIVEHLAVDAGYPEHFLTRQELQEKLDELGVSVPVQRGEAVRAAFEVLRDGVREKPEAKPEEKPAEKPQTQEKPAEKPLPVGESAMTAARQAQDKYGHDPEQVLAGAQAMAKESGDYKVDSEDVWAVVALLDGMKDGLFDSLVMNELSVAKPAKARQYQAALAAMGVTVPPPKQPTKPAEEEKPTASQSAKPEAYGRYQVEDMGDGVYSVIVDGKRGIGQFDSVEDANKHAEYYHHVDEQYKNIKDDTPLEGGGQGFPPKGTLKDIQEAAKSKLGKSYGGWAAKRYDAGRWQLEIYRVRDGYHGREKVIAATYQVSGIPPEPGFTGTDSLGRRWQDGKLVAKPDETGEGDSPSPQPVTAAELLARAGGTLDLPTLARLNNDIAKLERERQDLTAAGIPDRPGLQAKIDALKNERDRVAGVKEGEWVSEQEMQGLTATGKGPKKPVASDKPKIEPAGKVRIEWDGTVVPDENGKYNGFRVGDQYFASRAAAQRHIAAQQQQAEEAQAAQAEAVQQEDDRKQRLEEATREHELRQERIATVSAVATDRVKEELIAAGLADVARRTKPRMGGIDLPKNAPEEAQRIRDRVIAELSDLATRSIREKLTPDQIREEAAKLRGRAQPEATPDAAQATPDTAAQTPDATTAKPGNNPNEREVSRLVHNVVGPQEVTQARARAGGEVGPNGEWYPGGAFIATTDMPKRVRDKIDQSAKGKVVVNPGEWEVPKPGQMSILDKLGGTIFNHRDETINYAYLNYVGATPDDVKMYEGLLDKWKKGERWVSVNDYPSLANLKDVARLVVAGEPVPGAVLGKLPEEWRNHLQRYKPKSKPQE